MDDQDEAMARELNALVDDVEEALGAITPEQEQRLLRLNHVIGEIAAMRLPPGPWDGEPNELHWDAHGLPCVIVRSTMGHLCGYVGVSPAHPWFGSPPFDAELAYAAHGGVNYFGPLVGQGGFWFFGFDCAHLGDLTPAHAAMSEVLERPVFIAINGIYRTLPYVKERVEMMAEVLSRHVEVPS